MTVDVELWATGKIASLLLAMTVVVVTDVDETVFAAATSWIFVHSAAKAALAKEIPQTDAAKTDKKGRMRCICS